MLQKHAFIWITTKSLSHAKSSELFTTQFCSMGTSKLSPSLFSFPPCLPLAACSISYHKRALSILKVFYCIYSVTHHFSPGMRGFCSCFVQLLIGIIILCLSAENIGNTKTLWQASHGDVPHFCEGLGFLLMCLRNCSEEWVFLLCSWR